MRRTGFDDVIPVRLPRKYKVALRRIARKKGSDVSTIVRSLIQQCIDEEEGRPSPDGQGPGAGGTGSPGDDDDLRVAA